MSAAEKCQKEQRGLTAEELDAKIHTLTALQLLTQLENEECSAGILQCALRFLKDNDVTALPVPDSAMERIEKKLSLPYPRMSDASTEVESSQSGD